MTRHRRAPRRCPVCAGELVLTRLSCDDCETALSGAFESCTFCDLNDDERQMLSIFLLSRGNMKELERHLEVSYPTARSRFDQLIYRLRLAPEPPADERLAVLAALADGTIDIEEAYGRID